MTKLGNFLLPNAPTCIVACATSFARVWSSSTRFGDWKLVAEFQDAAAVEPEAAFASDRPGRAFDSFGSGRHAMSASETGREHEAQVFAREIGDFLNRAVAANDFTHIVLIAAPAFLGHLRTELSDSAQRAVILEAAKDLSDLDVDGVRQYFK